MEQYEIYSIMAIEIRINNIVIYLMLGAIMVMSQGISSNKLVPNQWGIINESLFRSMLSMVENYIGIKSTIYLPLIYSVFHLILCSNLIGMIPYSSTPTVELIMTLSIAVTLLLAILLMGMISQKLIMLQRKEITANFDTIAHWIYWLYLLSSSSLPTSSITFLVIGYPKW